MDEGSLGNKITGNSTKASVGSGVKIVIMSHGLGGSHYDLLKMKHFLSMIRPGTIFHSAKCNEEVTTEDIAIMGINLARETENLVTAYESKGGLDSLSFIGYSMGGLII